MVPNLGGEDSSAIDFLKIINTVPEFFEGFDNPRFLYKNATKYWKTRFLREFFSFSTMLNLNVGFHLSVRNQYINKEKICSSNSLKIFRCTLFPYELDEELKNNPKTRNHFDKKYSEILDKHQIQPFKLLRYGENYQTNPARLFHGSIIKLLNRYLDCWNDLYTSSVQQILKTIPKEKTNFDSRWIKKIDQPIVENLIKKRKGYLVNMAAVAELIVYYINYSAHTSYYARHIRESLLPFITLD